MRHLGLVSIIAVVLVLPTVTIMTPGCRYHRDSSLFSETMGPEETWLNGRRVLWQHPSAPEPPGGYPVIILLHGTVQRADAWFTSRHQWSAMQITFTEAALERGMFIVAPESRRPLPWGPRAWDAFADTVNTSLDLPFIEAIFDWLETQPVNQSAVSCTGFSSGAFMTSRISRVFPERLNAAAVHSGADATAARLTWLGPVLNCSASLPFPAGYPPTMVIHGQNDRVVPVACGINLYTELQRQGIPSQLMLTNDGHIWQADLNEEILDWLTAS